MQAFQIHLPDLAIIDISLEDEAEGGFDLMPRFAGAVGRAAHHLSHRPGQRARCGLRPASRRRRFSDQGCEPAASGGPGRRAVSAHRCAAAARQCRRNRAARRPVDRRRKDADDLERRPGHSVADRVLDRACAGAQSGACEEPAAIDGRRQCRLGRQHHHLSHQTHAPQVPADRCRLSMPSRPCTEWATAGSSEHSPAIADCRAHHPGAAVGGLSIRSRARDAHCATRRKNHCWRAPAPSPMRCRRSRSACSTTRSDTPRVFGQRRGSVRLSAVDPTPARWLSRRLGHCGGSDAPAHRHGLPQRGCRPGPPSAISIYTWRSTTRTSSASPNNAHPDQDRFDRVDLTLQGADGTRSNYFFATTAPGLIAAQSVVKGDDGTGCALRSSLESRHFGCRRLRATTWKRAFP